MNGIVPIHNGSVKFRIPPPKGASIEISAPFTSTRVGDAYILSPGGSAYVDISRSKCRRLPWLLYQVRVWWSGL